MKKRNFNKKNLILSVVALLLVTLLFVGVTYSWIEDITIVQIGKDSNNAQSNVPLTLAENIDGKYTVSSEEQYINLGPLWDANSNKKALVSSGTSVKYDNKDVNGRKGYFYESGGIHLTPCYGDGQNFYFKNSDTEKYVIGNHDNFNVDLISSTIQVSSPDAKTEFWFKNLSFTLKNSSGDTITNADDQIRVAIIADGTVKVFSNDGTCNSYSVDDEDTESISASSFASYTLDDNANNNAARDANGNTLFTVSKGETKNVTIRVWLEAGSNITNAVKADLEMELISSWSFNRTITVYDATTKDGGSSWADDSNAKLFLAIPSAKTDGEYKSAAEAAADTTGNTKQSYWPLTFQNVNNRSVASAEIPAVYNGEKMFIFRCNSSGWNQSGSDAAQRSSENIYCWNYWETDLPDSFINKEYSLYGGSFDNVVAGVYLNDASKATNKGYGTWDPVIEIQFKSVTAEGDHGLTAEYNLATNPKLFVEDYSDYASSGEIYYYTMYCYNKNSGNWKVYIPSTSTKIHFFYRPDGSTKYDVIRNFGYLTQTKAGSSSTGVDLVNSSKNPENAGGYSRPSNCQVFESKDLPNHYDNKLYCGDWKNTALDDTTSSSGSSSSTASLLTGNTAPSGKGIYVYGYKLDGVAENKWAKMTAGSNGEYTCVLNMSEADDSHGRHFYIRDCRSSTTTWTQYGSGNSFTLDRNGPRNYNGLQNNGNAMQLKVPANAVGNYEFKFQTNGNNIIITPVE